MKQINVEKLAEEYLTPPKQKPCESDGYNEYDVFKAYIDGHNKAKETLYTEDDIDKIFSYYKNGAPAYYIKNTYKKYLQSLKQPKQ